VARLRPGEAGSALFDFDAGTLVISFSKSGLV